MGFGEKEQILNYFFIFKDSQQLIEVQFFIFKMEIKIIILDDCWKICKIIYSFWGRYYQGFKEYLGFSYQNRVQILVLRQ